ncbi:formate/nitrite transporter family protein [Vagococcus carniphilus]|uniref:formate/nitrite transporter family protein n=1 Tax=Vagococcus carniphilus TaxID=218144 RepID=UPI002890E91C|nr:formate/nitrite transporter family protein [Vagococcus carniphilus]MDT2815666.1 formate/nitrite transporter family protein [Vagococcus carniphilus]
MEYTSELMKKIDGSIRKKNELIDKHFGKYAVRSLLATLYLSLGSAIALGLGLKFEEPVGKMLYAFTFGLGLVLIIFLNAELGTSNMMYMTVATYRKKLKPSKAFKILMVCVLFNLIGAFVVAYLLSMTGFFKALPDGNFLTHIVEGKFAKGPLQTVIEGMFANIIVNLAILMSMKAKDDTARFISILCVIFIFTFLGFEHVIANFIYFPLAYFSSGGAVVGMTVGAVSSNILFTFIGNYIGGGLVIGLTYAWLNNDEKLEYLD